MKFHLLSAYAIFLLVNIVLNIILGSQVALKKVSSGTAMTISTIQGLISFAFTVAIIYTAYKSDWKA